MPGLVLHRQLGGVAAACSPSGSRKCGYGAPGVGRGPRVDGLPTPNLESPVMFSRRAGQRGR